LRHSWEHEQQYIKAYLTNIRQLDPIEIVTLPNPIKLSETSRMTQVVDVEHFWEMVNRCLEECTHRYSIDITLIAPERYYIAPPSKANAVGGFHDPKSLGYQYWYHAAFVMTLNEHLASKELRTLELVRNFLHDCFHHSTFRSYRRALRIPAESVAIAKNRIPEVYREQYGINFRDKDGFSYSSTELTAQSPETINLNLLMDGVIVLTVADLMRRANGGVPTYTNKIEEELIKEIFLEPFDALLLPRAHRFYTSVAEPSQKFVERWGGDSFVPILLQAMISGELSKLKHFFQERTGIVNAWEQVFKRPEFLLPPDSAMYTTIEKD
jgi:hypothetical protein